MDDLQNLDGSSVDSQVNSALGYSPKKAVQSTTPKYSDFDVNKTYGTPARLLDNLNQTESSSNPYVVQKDTKAMGNYQFLPDTASMLNKQGIKFNAFDPKESRAAADYYIQQLVKQNGGDYNAAMAQYGGIKKTDPTTYLSKVLNGVDVKNQQIPQQLPSNDPLSNLSGGSVDLAVQGALNEGKNVPPPKPIKVFNPDADIPTDVITTPTAANVQPTAQQTSNLPSYKMTLQNINVGKNNVAPTPTVVPDYQKAINAVNTTNAGDIEQKYVTPAVEAGLALATGATTGLLSGIISTLTPASKAYIDAERKAWQAQNPNEPYNKFEQAFLKGVQAGTYQPKSEGGKQAVSAISDVLSTLPPTLPGELGALGAEREATSGVSKTLQDQFISKKTATPRIEPTIGETASAGAAATSHEAAVNEALSSASPKVQSAFVNEKPENINLEALNTHKQFDKFDMQPTEGEALQDTSKMSDEWNDRTIDPALQHRFEERNPKLIEAFDKLTEKASPDIYEKNPVKLADQILTKLKTDDDARVLDITNKYQRANEVLGTGESPIDVGALKDNIDAALKKAQRTRYVPEELKADLNDALSKGYLTPEEYENFRTDTALIARTSKPLQAKAASIIRQQLENVPLKGEFAQYKPLFDEARKAVADRKNLIDSNPAYKVAISDTRTPDEALTLPHPASATFLDKNVTGKNVSQVNVQRLVDQLGQGSVEHQALQAAVIQDLKQKSGIINNQGNVSQKTLNAQIQKELGSKLDTIHGAQLANDIRDLGEVARKSEHVRGGPSFANTSNTESVRKRSALGAAKDFTKAAAAKGLEAYLNMHTMGAGGTLLKSMVQGSKEEKALAALEAEKQALSRKRLGPGAGAKISDIGK